MQGTKIIGPLLGGVILARVGPTAAYLILAVLYGVALVLTVTLVRRVALPAPGSTGESIIGSLGSGFAEARSQPAIMGVLLITVWMNFLVFPYQQIMPVFARDVL